MCAPVLGAVVLALTGDIGPAVRIDAGQFPIVLHVAGIGVGTLSNDADVVAMHGEGLFVIAEGHGGGRYFTNASGSITLHTEIGVDGCTESLELRQGLHIPGVTATTVPASAISSALDSFRHADHGIKLGMSAARLLAKLGRPMTDETTGTRRALYYEISSEDDDRVGLFYQARYELVKDRLVTISLYDGE